MRLRYNNRRVRLAVLLGATVLSWGALFSQACYFGSQSAEAGTTMSEPSQTALQTGAPDKPRKTVNTALPQKTRKTITVAAGGDLQAALNQAQPGDVITLAAGAVFTGSFVLPNKPGADWITIRTAAPDTSLPPPGKRISPASAAALPKILSPGASPALTVERGAHHYRLIGLELGVTPGKSIYTIVDFDGAPRSLGEMARDLIVDRCYIHGNPGDGSQRGVALNCGAAAIIDSYLAEIHLESADSQAICGWNGPGPFKIVNNYLEGAGENILFGGADSAIQGLIPSDIEIRNNTVAKPLSWRPGSSNFGGITWSVKNLFELKNAQRVLVDRNIFEYNWAQSQDGMAILFTPRNQDGNSPWSVVQDVTFTNNIVRHSGGGINIAGPDDEAGPSEPSRRILIRNNLLDDIDGVKWGTPTEAADGEFLQIIGGAENITIEHNTAIHNGNILTSDGADKPNPGFAFISNITLQNSNGVIGSEHSPGLDSLDTFFPNSRFQANAIIGAESKMYPPGNFFPATLNQVGFTDQAGKNYRLLPASPYRNKGTDGRDIGCNFDELLSQATAATVEAASYGGQQLAEECIVAVFGTELASEVASAPGQPLPVTLAGTSITIRDSAGTQRPASLFFVSPLQVNLLLPSGLALGAASLLISTVYGQTVWSPIRVGQISPGLFTADSSGGGLPQGQVFRLGSNGAQSFEPVIRYDTATSRWVAVPIEQGKPDDQIFLILYGSGFRHRPALSDVQATIGGLSAPVLYAGAQGGYAGLDQLNLSIPAGLEGRGDAEVSLLVAGLPVNRVIVNFK